MTVRIISIFEGQGTVNPVSMAKESQTLNEVKIIEPFKLVGDNPFENFEN